MTFLTIFKLLGKYYWIALALLILYLFYGRQNQKELAEGYKEIKELNEVELIRWKDKAEKNRARADIAEVKARHAKEVLGDKLKRMLQKEVGNIKKNLISYSSVKASTAGEVQGALKDTVYYLPQQPDPIKAKQYTIKNKYLEFEAFITADSLFADYKVYHHFDLTYYYKRPGKPPFNLFRRKKAVAEIKFDNPGSQADSVYSVVLEREKGWLRKLLGM